MSGFLYPVETCYAVKVPGPPIRSLTHGGPRPFRVDHSPGGMGTLAWSIHAADRARAVSCPLSRSISGTLSVLIPNGLGTILEINTLTETAAQDLLLPRDLLTVRVVAAME